MAAPGQVVLRSRPLYGGTETLFDSLLAGLGIVHVGKPLAALLVTVLLGYSTRTGLVIALGLAQIGEFSFILGDLARQHGLLGETGNSLLVACALVSISLNPFLFRWLDPIEGRLRRHPGLFSSAVYWASSWSCALLTISPDRDCV